MKTEHPFIIGDTWLSQAKTLVTIKGTRTNDDGTPLVSYTLPSGRQIVENQEKFRDNYSLYYSLTLTIDAINEQGRKDDSFKPRHSLIPQGTISSVIEVLEHGAQKYDVDNWKQVPDARIRYYDAAMRHIDSWYKGEQKDEESDLPHLAHAICCLLFLMWLDNNGDK